MAITKVTNDLVNPDPTNASNLSSGSVPTAQLGNVDTSGITANQDDIALLGFKVAANGSLARYNLVDQSIDAFEDASGVDDSASSDAVRDASNFYSGAAVGNVTWAYTGSEQSWSVPSGVNGVATVQLWGAGGGGEGDGGGMRGGGGGYTTGNITIADTQTYKIVIGGGGETDTTNGNHPASYGGGGNGYENAAGGGYSGIFLTSVTQGNAKGIAGGGGGGDAGSDYGGGGGGASGGTHSGPNHGVGGSQVAGGAYGGLALQGGNGQDRAGGSSRWVSGGGGGYYGGGSGQADDASGGGGSGYIGGLASATTTAGTNGGDGAGEAADNWVTPVGKGGGEAGPTNGGNGLGYIGWDFVTDMTLVSNALTAESAPTNGDLVMTISNGAGTTTPNTDIKAYVSRDGSAYSSAVTLVDQGDTGGHTILTANGVDLSGITSGTSMRWKITTHNQSVSKTTRIQAVSLGWS